MSAVLTPSRLACYKDLGLLLVKQRVGRNAPDGRSVEVVDDESMTEDAEALGP